VTFRELFCSQIKAENKKGSGTASSYISALNFLDEILRRTPVCGVDKFWGLDSADAVHELYQFALKNQKVEGSVFLDGTHPPSYGRGGYYSAALMS